MTQRELDLEWEYLYQERLGIMCGTDAPTVKQMKMASDYATKEIERKETNEQSV